MAELNLDDIPNAVPGVTPSPNLDDIPDAAAPAPMGREEQEEKVSLGRELLDEAWQTAQEIGSVYPLVEAAAHITSGLYGTIIAGFAGISTPSMIADLLRPGTSSKVIETVQDWLVYQPQTERGQHVTEGATYPFAVLDKLGGTAGTAVLDKTNSPLLAAGVHATIAAAPAFLGLRNIPKSVIADIGTSTVFRRMTIKERSLALKSLDDVLRDNPNMTEAQVLRRWNGFKTEALAKRAIKGEPTKRAVVAEEPTKYGQWKKETVKDIQKDLVREQVEAGKPVPREALELYKGETWADKALKKPAAIEPDIPTDEEIDVAFPDDGEILPAEAVPDTSFEFGANIEGVDVVPIVDEPISTQFADHADAYLRTIIDLVETGERGRLLFLEKAPGEGGGAEVTGYSATYPEWMKERGYSAKEVLVALEKALEGKTLGAKQEGIVLDALEEAQTMFLEDIEKHYPDAYNQAERSIEWGIHRILTKKLRVQATKKHFDLIRRSMERRPAKGSVKRKVRETTGQIKVSDMVRADIAFKEQMKAAARAARKAFSEGKKEAVAKERMKIRLLKERAKASRDVRMEFNRMKNVLKKIRTEKMSPEQAEPIKELLNGLDFTKMMARTRTRLEKMKAHLEQNPDAEMTAKMTQSLERLEKVPLADLTLDEVRDVFNAVMHNVKLDKLKKQIKVGRETRRAESVLRDSLAEMRPIKTITDEIIESRPERPEQRGWRLIKDTFGIRHDHYDLIVESLAGRNSIMDQVLYQDVKAGIITELKFKQDTFEKFQKDLEATGYFGKGKAVEHIDKWLDEKVKTGRFRLTRNERMALYRHSLNEDNRTAIITGGFGLKNDLSPNKVHEITAEDFDAIIDSLTKEEKAFAGKAVNNLFDKQGKLLADVFYEKNGYPMPREDKYYPKEVMPVKRGLELETEEALEQFKGKWLRVGLSKGMLIQRLGSKKPIYLNGLTYDINKSVMRAAAYIGLELPLSNASKLLYDPVFKAQLSDAYGKVTWREIEKGLRDIAGDWQTYGMMAQLATVDKLAMQLKNKMSTAILGLNPFTMANQLVGFSMYWPFVDAPYLIQGLVDMIFHGEETLNRHLAYSPEFKERLQGGFQRDVADVFKTESSRRLFGGGKRLPQKTMSGVQFVDARITASGMQAAVLQVLDEFDKGKLSREVRLGLNMTDADIADLSPADKMRLAYKFADYATERSQDMPSTEHRSALSRGSTFEQMWTMFGSSTNQILNLMRRSYREARRTKDPKAYEKLAKTLFAALVIDTMFILGVNEVRDWLYKREDEKGFIAKLVEAWSGYFFFLRDIMSSVISKITLGTWRGYDVSLPVQRPIELLPMIITNFWTSATSRNKAKRDKAAAAFVDQAAEFILMMMGLPYQTPKKIITRGGKK